MKLTLVTVNGVSFFAKLEVNEKGEVKKLSKEEIKDMCNKLKIPYTYSYYPPDYPHISSCQLV
jgi:hypothetical protein